MSEVAIWLETELMALLVEMLEEGFFERGVSWVYDYCLDRTSVDLAKELEVISDTINEDLTLRELVRLGRQERSAIHFLVHYLKLFRRYQKKCGLSIEQTEAVDRFELLIEQLTLASLGKEPEQELRGFVDWAAKLCLLKTITKKRGKDLWAVRSSDLSGRKTRGVDQETLSSYLEKSDDDFHDVRDSGGYNKMDRMGLCEHVVTEESIVHAMENPPKDTRASLRRYYEELAEERGLLIKMYGWSWDRVEAMTIASTLPGIVGFSAKLDDPFQVEP
jgi:proteasome accessory factor A